MPFGVTLSDDGTVRFRLWAPGAERVALVLKRGEGQNNQEYAMPKTPDGFAEISLKGAEAPVGSQYQFKINNELLVPDPASRYQSTDVHGASVLIDPEAFPWQDADWRGRPWEETVIYELHVGTFTPTGTFQGVKEKLDELVDLGITAIELMPLADFPGQRNWGYDGVLPFAPDNRYGTPDDLKDLIQTAHQKGLMVFLDVVYNHFGPEGNYLYAYADRFFTDRYQTPWGAALDFEQDPTAKAPNLSRDFFIHNTLYWLEEYHLDGLRFDAVHAIFDSSKQHFLEALAEAVRTGPAAQRPIHLMLENDANQPRYLARRPDGSPVEYTAQWNDDIHHVLHVLISGENDGYYADYAQDSTGKLIRCLSEGFCYQGEPSPYREGERRGEPSPHLPPTAFISFIQNHDQVGNRAFGDRLTQFALAEKVRMGLATYLLAPQIPMLFMGEEWGASTPFPFFCDFEAELAPKVTEGRRKEFARFPQFSQPEMQARIPDPCHLQTFESARLDWTEREQPEHAQWLEQYRKLLALRQEKIVPLLVKLSGNSAGSQVVSHRLGDHAFQISWRADDGHTLTALMNWGEIALSCHPPEGELIYSTGQAAQEALRSNTFSALTTAWFIQPPP